MTPPIYTLSKSWVGRYLKVRYQDLGVAVVPGKVLLVDTAAEPIEGPGYLIGYDPGEGNNRILAEVNIIRDRRKLVWIDPSMTSATGPISEVIGKIVARLSHA